MRGIYSIILASLALTATQVAADPLYNKPVYNPETKSYFEFYSPDPEKVSAGGLLYGISWQAASRMAIKRTYHGVRGRLAVVKTRQAHEFLRDTFQPNVAAWIGLRYWCRYRKLQWVTGEVYPVKAFAPWGSKWNEVSTNRSPVGKETKFDACPFENDPKDHNGVHYWPIHQGFVWNANIRDKNFSAMFIEYPTGKP